MNLLRRTFGFSIVPIVTTMISFAIVPLLTRIVGKEGFAQILVGQSVGVIAVIIIGCGWDIEGPPKIAIGSEKSRKILYSEGFLSRITLFAILAPICFIIPNILTSGPYGTAAGILAIANALGGVYPSWYIVGIGKPALAIKYDLIPRIGLMLCLLLVFFQTRNVFLYAFLTLFMNFLILISYNIFVSKPIVFGRRKIWQIYRTNFPASMAMMIAGIYSSAALLIVASATIETELSLYGAGEMGFKIGLLSLIILGNSLQGWVVEGGNSAFITRIKFAFILFAALGIVGCVIYTNFASWATGFVLGENFKITHITAFWFGIAFLFLSIGTCTGRLALVPLGKTKELMSATIFGALIGVPSIFLGAHFFGASGGAFGLAASEIVVFIVQGFYLRKYLRSDYDIELIHKTTT